MTSFYGSTAQPKNIFGEGQLLDIFTETMEEGAPYAWELNQACLAIWNPDAISYELIAATLTALLEKVLDDEKHEED